MQNSSSPTSPRDCTRQRLLDAAARVFAEHGLAGATTRAIAEAAGVNEVTLFRHFHTKDGLLAAVVGQNFGAEAPAPADPPPPVTSDLRADLLAHAERYWRVLSINLPLVRTMIGEIQHRHRDQASCVFHGVFRGVKADLLTRIGAAQEAGLLRNSLSAEMLADLLAATLFTGVLRRDAPGVSISYTAESYREAAVDLLLRGAAPGQPGAT